jgi:hypothetical protein
VLVSYLLMSQEMKRVDCKGSFLFSLCKEKCVRWLIIFFKDRPRRLKQWGQTFFEAEFEFSLSYQLSQYGYNLQFQAKIRKCIEGRWREDGGKPKWIFKCDTKVCFYLTTFSSELFFSEMLILYQLSLKK